MGVHLIGMHLVGVHLVSVSHRYVSLGRASQRYVPYRRV